MRNTKKINNSEVSLLLQQERELVLLQLKVKLMQKLATASGFFSYYFENLKSFLKREQCFNHVNDLYFELFGHYRYDSYSNFKNNVHGIA